MHALSLAAALCTWLAFAHAAPTEEGTGGLEFKVIPYPGTTDGHECVGPDYKARELYGFTGSSSNSNCVKSDAPPSVNSTSFRFVKSQGSVPASQICYLCAFNETGCSQGLTECATYDPRQYGPCFDFGRYYSGPILSYQVQCQPFD